MHKLYKAPFGIVMPALVLMVMAAILLAACFGSAKIMPYESMRLILKKIPLVRNFIGNDGIKEVYSKIIWNVRLPRIILAGMVGMGLSVVGAAFQGVLGNPLADPNILGVSSGAAAGATVAIVSGISFNFLGLGIIGILAFIGALITVFMVYVLSFASGRSSDVRLILTGTAVSSLLSSFISLVMAMRRDQLEKVYLWTLGSFSAATWGKIAFLSIFIVICSAVIIAFSRELDILTLGADSATSLGVPVKHVKKLIIVVSSLIVAACVSVSGIVGFIGLIIPHCVRLLFGPSHKKLLPYSMAVGAIFTIICDTIARTIAAPSEIPVGVITAVFGAPYFIFLLQKTRTK